MRQKAKNKFPNDEPLVLIGSPMCTNFSSILNLIWPKMDEEETERRMKHVRVHLKFCLELHRMQHEAGRYFSHEHPRSATSWGNHGVMISAGVGGVMETHAHMCRHGVEQGDV